MLIKSSPPIKSSTLSVRTASTSFYPQSSSAAPLWWKVATARSFILNEGIVTDIMPAILAYFVSHWNRHLSVIASLENALY